MDVQDETCMIDVVK